jgi:biofilm protein TabA
VAKIIPDMKKIFKYNLLVLAVSCFIGGAAFAQNNLTEKTAAEWVKKGEWRNGFKLKPYNGLDNAEFAKQYHKNKALWDKAFCYLRAVNLDTLSVGKHLIDGENVFATVTDAATKPFEQTAWESHRKYIDLHLMIRGKEKIGVMDPATAKVTDAYDAAKDLAHYDASANGTYYIADPETLLIFFPQNAHRPGIHADGYDKVKKLVIKIRAAE